MRGTRSSKTWHKGTRRGGRRGRRGRNRKSKRRTKKVQRKSRSTRICRRKNRRKRKFKCRRRLAPLPGGAVVARYRKHQRA